jgi:hypothetical protein
VHVEQSAYTSPDSYQPSQSLHILTRAFQGTMNVFVKHVQGGSQSCWDNGLSSGFLGLTDALAGVSSVEYSKIGEGANDLELEEAVVAKQDQQVRVGNGISIRFI